MIKRYFALRVDLESYKGIKYGLPNILDLLAEFDLKASFYLVMGGESNLIELLRYREKIKGERKIKVYTLKEKLRIALFPCDFVTKNLNIIRRILREGHELGIHGWKHRAWTRALDKINIEEHIKKAKQKYIKLFSQIPISFAAPGFRTNMEVIKLLDKYGFKVISDLPGEKPFKIKGTNIINVPVNICGNDNMPIIESLTQKRYNDDKIVTHLVHKIKKTKYSVMYIHGLFEGMNKIELLRNLFLKLKKNNINIRRIVDIAKL